VILGIDESTTHWCASKVRITWIESAGCMGPILHKLA
jgi:hypothetical protein